MARVFLTLFILNISIGSIALFTSFLYMHPMMFLCGVLNASVSVLMFKSYHAALGVKHDA